MIRFLWVAALIAAFSSAALGKDIAKCGASDGYSYFPKAGLGAADQDTGEWHRDGIKDGRFTLTEISENVFDLLILDASGGIYSAKQDGAKIIILGSTKKSLSFLVSYPNAYVETYTFMRNEDDDAEAMWTSNKWGTPIPKAGAYRASCSFFVLR